MRRREYQSGFSTTVILLVVLVVAVLAVTAFLVYQRHKPSTVKNSASTSQTQPPSQQGTTNTQTTQPAYANWPVYSNTQYGFSFSYPSTWRVEPGDPAASLDAQHTELLLSLIDTSAPTTQTTQNKTMYIEVSSRDLASKTALFDGSIDSEGGKSADYKQSLTLKGRATIKYTIPQSKTVNREIYFFGVGTKTYTVSTTNEEANIARNPTYLNQFNTVVDSLRLP
jgi:hypothetical protein